METKPSLTETGGAADSVLDREWAYYTDNRDWIAREYRDKYVVISGGRVVAAYDDENEAYYGTIKTIPVGSFIIQHATDPEEVFYLTPVLL